MARDGVVQLASVEFAMIPLLRKFAKLMLRIVKTVPVAGFAIRGFLLRDFHQGAVAEARAFSFSNALTQAITSKASAT